MQIYLCDEKVNKKCTFTVSRTDNQSDNLQYCYVNKEVSKET